MQRRRGLVSQPTKPNAIQSASVLALRRKLASDSDDEEHVEVEKKSREEELQSVPPLQEESTQSQPQNVETRKDPDNADSGKTATDTATATGEVKKHSKGKKTQQDFSDESRWKKMKIKGVDREIMVDLTRVQKYVDYDSTGVESFKQEVDSAKGNFRQQALADYSDL